jgi:hypothetical protein
MGEASNPQAGVQVAVVTGRGCGHPWVANPELPGSKSLEPVLLSIRRVELFAKPITSMKCN